MDRNFADEILRSSDDLRDAHHLVDVEGMSSARVCTLLNRLVAAMDPGEHYLEIGCWKGRTLLSAAHGNVGRLCVGCDKFRLWGRYTGWGHRVRRELAHNIERCGGGGAEIRLFEMTARRLFATSRVPGPVGVYFYDGGHDYADTRHGVSAVVPLLSRRATLLVDDWNDATIRRATFDALAATGAGVMWHRHLPGDHSERGFWNGLGVFHVECPVASVTRGRSRSGLGGFLTLVA